MTHPPANEQKQLGTFSILHAWWYPKNLLVFVPKNNNKVTGIDEMDAVVSTVVLTDLKAKMQNLPPGVEDVFEVCMHMMDQHPNEALRSLWIRDWEEFNILCLLARTRYLKLNAILVRSTLLGTTVSADRRHERCVDSKLCAAPKRQAVGDHLELTTIPRGNTLQIHVPEERYSGPGLTANTSERFFQRKGSPSDNTASRTSSPVIARLVQRSPAATAPGYQGKR